MVTFGVGVTCHSYSAMCYRIRREYVNIERNINEIRIYVWLYLTTSVAEIIWRGLVR
jgi:hypothetical protein